MIKNSIFLLLIFFGLQLKAQQYLYIKKTGKIPAERIGLYEDIKIRVQDSDEWFGGKVQMIGPESITLENRTFLFKDIESIRTYDELSKLTGTAMYVGGTFFTAIAFINRSVNGDRPLLYPSQIALGASLVGVGIIIRLLSRNTYSLSKGYIFEVIDVNNL